MALGRGFLDAGALADFVGRAVRPVSWLMKSLASAERAAVVAAFAVLRFSTPIVPIRPGEEAR